MLEGGGDSAVADAMVIGAVEAEVSPLKPPESLTLRSMNEVCDENPEVCRASLSAAKKGGVDLGRVTERMDEALGFPGPTKNLPLFLQVASTETIPSRVRAPEKDSATGQYAEVDIDTLVSQLSQLDRLTQAEYNSLADMGNDDDLLNALVDRLSTTDVDDWRKLEVYLGLSKVEDAVRWRESRYDFSPPSLQQDALSPPLQWSIEQRKSRADFMHDLMRDKGVDINLYYSAESLWRSYGALRDDDRLSFADVRLFNELVVERVKYSAVDSVDKTADSILAFKESFVNSDRATRQVISSSDADSRLVIALDKYIAQAGDDKDPNVALKEAVSFGKFITERLSGVEVDTITKELDDWMGRGMSLRDIQRVMGSKSMLLRAGDKLKEDLSRSLVVKLSNMEVAALTDAVVDRFRNAAHYADDRIEKIIDVITRFLPAVIESKYPQGELQDSIESAICSNGQLDETMDWIGRKFRAMALIGDNGARLKAVADGWAIGEIMGDLRSGIPLSYSELSKMTRTLESIRGVANDTGVGLLPVLAGWSRVLDDKIVPVVDVVKRFHELTTHFCTRGYIDSLKSIAGEHNAGLWEVVSLMYGAGMRRAERTLSTEEASKYIDDIFSEMEDVLSMQEFANIPPILIAKAFLDEMGSAASPEEFGALLSSQPILNILQRPHGDENIKDSLPLLRRNYGEYNIDRASELLMNPTIEDAHPLWFIISAESSLSDGRRAMFYQIAEKFLPALDKDGSPYDSPEMIRDAIEEGRTDDLKWFVDAERRLPIAAFSSVAIFRDEALHHGVTDSPESVYEYMHSNPEHIRKLSGIYLRHAVEELRREGDPPAEYIIERAHSLADELGETVRLCINMHPEALRAITDGDQQIKSVWDLGGERLFTSHVGSVTIQKNPAYNYRRSGVEIALGIRSLGENEAHATYGSLAFFTGGVPEGAIGYGDIMLSFRVDEDLNSRSSYTPEDSFHGARRLTREDAMALRLIKNAYGIGTIKTSDYIEAQVVGGVNISNVEFIYVSSDDQARLVPAFLSDRVRVMSRNDKDYDNSREVSAILTGWTQDRDSQKEHQDSLPAQKEHQDALPAQDSAFEIRW